MTSAGCGRGAGSIEVLTSALSPSGPGAGAYVLDPEHSFIYFAAQHMVVGRVRGRFNSMQGTARAGTDIRSSRVDVVVDASSVDTQLPLRDAELRGPDFLDAARFPTIEFHGSGFRQLGERWFVDGALMIRGTARNVRLELVFKGPAPGAPGTPARLAVHATTEVRRADFGMIRGLLNEIGAVSANPDVWIEIDAQFVARGQSRLSEPGNTSQSLERR